MFTNFIENNIENALQTLGITANSQKLFKILLERGPMRASSLAKASSIRRELTYRALEELENAGLIKKIDPKNGVALFQTIHPELIVKKLKESTAHIESVQHVLETSMATLVGAYNKGVGLPAVEFKEGEEGLAYLYNDVIETGEPVKLIRSPLDVRHPDIKKMINDHRNRQIKHKIHTEMVSSVTNPKLTYAEVLARDKKHLVTRHLLPRNMLQIPAQIMIYGEKVAITSFDGEIVTTIIENKAIETTFRTLFAILWNLGKPVSTFVDR
jgi:sugar-specific transcriptional regulator TrmB